MTIVDPTDSKGEAISQALHRVVEGIPVALCGAVTWSRLQDLAATPTANSASHLAALLLQLGLPARAQGVFETLAIQCPRSPAGLAGLAQIAMRRRHWELALTRWRTLVAGFPESGNAQWIFEQASALYELGRVTEAEAHLEAARGLAPVALTRTSEAWSAMRRRRWREAVERWDAVLADLPEGTVAEASWRTARAVSLFELGRPRDAEEGLWQIIETDPGMVWALQTLMRIYWATGRHAQALWALGTSIFADAELPMLFAVKVQVLRSLWRIDGARVAFARLLQHADELEALDVLFLEAPQLHEGRQLTETWIELLRRTDELPVLSTEDEARDRNVLRARIQLALKDQDGFLLTVSRIGARSAPVPLEASLRRVAAALSDPAYPDFRKPKVFCIGLSKTGTTSLAKALEILHLDTLHWSNPLTNELIAEADLPLFDAFTDLPVCLAFEKYLHQFPNSKFIYTIRRIESWVDSFDRHWQRNYNLAGFEQVKAAFDDGREFYHGSYLREIHHQLYLRHSSATAAYIAHDERVRRVFQGPRRERFLEMDIFNGDGWEKLCRFLGAEIPSRPFPLENRDTDA